MIVITRVFIPGKPFQPSLMFANKIGAYQSGVPESERRDIHSRSGLTRKHWTRLGRFTKKNTLAYYKH